MISKHSTHRLLATIVAVLMIIGMVPGAFAETGEQPPITTEQQVVDVVTENTDVIQGAADRQTTVTEPNGNTPNAPEKNDIPDQKPAPAAGTVKVSLSLACGSDMPVAGVACQLTAEIRGLAQAPKGKITFYEGETVIGSASASQSGASVSWTPSTAGSHTITAEFIPAKGDVHTYAATQTTVSVSAPARAQVAERHVQAPPDNSGNVGQTSGGTDTTQAGGNVDTTQTSNGSAAEQPRDNENTRQNNDPAVSAMIASLTANRNEGAKTTNDNSNADASGENADAPSRQRTFSLADLLSGNTTTTNSNEKKDDADKSDDETKDDADKSDDETKDDADKSDDETKDDVDKSDDETKDDADKSDDETKDDADKSDDETKDNADKSDDENGDDERGIVSTLIGLDAAAQGVTNLSLCNVSFTGSYVFNGQSHQPPIGDMIVSLPGGGTLVAGTDYELDTNPYGTNVNAGPNAGTVRIRAITTSTLVTGAKTANFAIEPMDIAGQAVTVTPALTSLTYTGSPQIPNLSGKTLQVGGISLGQSYSVANDNNTDAGNATVIITGTGNFKGSTTVGFTITPRSIAQGVTILVPEKPYDGTTTVPPLTVRYGAKNLVRDTDFTVSEPSSADPGTYQITITGIGNFEGSVVRNLVIRRGWLSDAKIDLTDALYEVGGMFYYTIAAGETIEPRVVVSIGALTLNPGTDYQLEGQTRTTIPGTFTITVRGLGTYAGSVKYVQYTVGRSIDTGFYIQPIPDQRFTGRPVTPLVTVVNGNGQVLSNRYYTVAYENNTNRGTATVYVYGANGYVGKLSSTFQITEAATRMELAPYQTDNALVLYARVIGASPTGTVTFTVVENGGNTQTYDAVLNSNGEARYTLTRTGNVHSYQVYAYYGGDSNNNPVDAGPVSFNTARLFLEVMGREANGYVQLRATINSTSGYWPTGRITFKMNDTIVGYAPIDNRGQATFYAYVQNWGKVTLTAYYEGDGHFAPMTSNTVTLNDGQGQQVPTVKFKARTSSSSHRVAYLTATVTGRWYGQPTGYVDFYNGTTLIGTSQLSTKGEATLTWRNIASGTYTLYAVYRGDSVYRGESAMITYKRPNASSGGSGSSGGNTNIVTPSTPIAQPNDLNLIQLRDTDGNVVANYDPSNLKMQDEVLVLETNKSMDYYSYSFGVQRLKALANSSEGYYNIVTPGFNFHVPFNIMTNMGGYSDFLVANSLNESQVQLRVNMRRITDNALSAAYTQAHPGKTPTAVYRVEIELYDASGRKLDFATTGLESPALLLLPVTRQSGIAERYDEQLGTFSEVPLTFSNNVGIVTVEQSGIYVIATDSF